MYGKYDPKLIDVIQKTYKKYNGNYGYKQIHIALNYDLDIKVNISTIIRYMKHLKLKAKIRQKKKNSEIKNVNTNIPNLIIKNFNTNKLNQKWYTDITYHGHQYSSISFQKLLKNNNIKQSISIIGNSLDNRPIEYFFSILKQKYLRLILIRNIIFDKKYNQLEYNKWHYSNIIFQSNLQNKTS